MAEHGFSADCMNVLGAICESLIPSVKLHDADAELEDATTEQEKQIISAFYERSGTDAGLPDQLAATLTAFIRPSDLADLRKLLWLLSTRLGTLLLCGRQALIHRSNKQINSKIQKKRSLIKIIAPFPALPLDRREQILRSWSASQSLRLPFTVFKMILLRIFYSKADSTLWKALEYHGPDPRPASAEARPDSCDIDLQSRIVDMNQPSPETAIAKLGLQPQLLQRVSDSDRPSSILRLNVDAVVVGSGSGGAVVAAQLAQAGHSVVILEKGSYLARSDNTLLELDSYGLYEYGSYLASADGGVCIFAGNTVGGGSAINWSASFRTPAHVRREWAEKHGLELFAGEDYGRALEEVCDRMGVQEEIGEESLANGMLRKGCTALGMHVGHVPRNAARDHYCGWCGMGCKSGQKQSTTRTWLVDAARCGAVILANCEARKVLVADAARQQSSSLRLPRGGRKLATGVLARSTHCELQVDAKVVVAAAGSLWTPVLLRRSGLRNPQIGKNLRLHPVMITWACFDKDVVGGRRSYEGGIMTSYSAEAANWETSGYGAVLMVPTAHPGAFSAFMPWRGGRHFKDFMRRFARTVCTVAITRDSSPEIGEVEEEPDGRLIVKYKMSDVDRSHCLEAVGNAIRALSAAGAARVGTVALDGEDVVIDGDPTAGERLERFVSHVKSTSIRNCNTPLGSAHQMGTCRMGTSPATSAVDPSGKTWEIDGLFVADASVFPSASGVNPMVTVMAIALCTSRSVIAFLRQESTCNSRL